MRTQHSTVQPSSHVPPRRQALLPSDSAAHRAALRAPAGPRRATSANPTLPLTASQHTMPRAPGPPST